MEAPGSVLVTDFGRVVRVDLATGNRSVVSGYGVGSGPRFFGLGSITVQETTKTVLVVDSASEAVIEVDPANGTRKIVAAVASVGNGPAMFAPEDIVVEAPGSGSVLVINRDQTDIVTRVDFTIPNLMRLDLATGHRSIVSGCPPDVDVCSEAEGIGSGTPFSSPRGGIAMEAPDSVLVADSDKLLRVDLATGNRMLVSGCPGGPNVKCSEAESIGNGPPLLDSGSIRLADPGSAIVISHGFKAVMRVELATGDRTLVTRSTRPEPVTP